MKHSYIKQSTFRYYTYLKKNTQILSLSVLSTKEKEIIMI